MLSVGRWLAPSSHLIRPDTIQQSHSHSISRRVHNTLTAPPQLSYWRLIPLENSVSSNTLRIPLLGLKTSGCTPIKVTVFAAKLFPCLVASVFSRAVGNQCMAAQPKANRLQPVQRIHFRMGPRFCLVTFSFYWHQNSLVGINFFF